MSSDERSYIWVSSWNVSEKLDIPKVLVHDIVYEYLCNSREVLKSGGSVNLFGLFTVTSKDTISGYIPTFAYTCMEIANKLSLPNQTVYHVMKDYIDNAIRMLKEGLVVEFRGICTMHPLRDSTGNIKCINTNIAQGLKEYTGNSALRVYTCKWLRQDIRVAYKEAVGQ